MTARETDCSRTDDIFRLHVLGVGNPFSRYFNTTSFVLQAGRQLILIEAPMSLNKRLYDYVDRRDYADTRTSMRVRTDLDILVPENINDLVISHDDLDHSAGLADFGLFKYFVQEPAIPQGAERPRLYAAPDVAAELVRNFSDRFYKNATSFEDCIELVEVPHGSEAVRIGGGEVSMFTCNADHGKAAFGMYFEYRGRSFAYSGDTKFNIQLLDFLSMADVMVHECTGVDHVHTRAEDLAKWHEESGYKGRLYTCHFRKSSIPKEHGLKALKENTSIDI